MRFGDQRKSIQVLAVIFAVLACCSLASAKPVKKASLKKPPSARIATNQNLAQAQIEKNQTLGTQQDLINLRKKGSLKPKVRKFMNEAEGRSESPNPELSQSITSESFKSDERFTSGAFQVSRGTSLYDFQDGTRKDSMDAELRLNLNFWPYPGKLRVIGGYSRDLKQEESSDFSDTSIAYLRTYGVGETFALSPSVTVIAPTSKVSQRLNNSNGAIRIGAGISHTSAKLIGWEAGAGLSAGQNFHQYDTATNGATLSKYSLNQSVSTSYSYKKVGISASFVHRNGWTYEGALKESFEHTEELGWQITKMFAAAIGHTNGGSALKANAQDTNIELISENSSMVYGALTVNF